MNDNRLNARLYISGCWLLVFWYVDKEDDELRFGQSFGMIYLNLGVNDAGYLYI